MINPLIFYFIAFILTIFLIFCNCSIANNSDYKIYSSEEYKSKIPNNDNERIVFVVDFSNSMNEYLGNRRKIEVALLALKEILPKIPKNIQIGLRVYGYRNGVTMLDACMASKSAVSMDYGNSEKIYNALERITPVGMTPITFSIKQSLKNDFGLWQGKKRLVILTDGGENCDESPCEYAMKLVGKRDDIKIDVIAFSIDDKNAISQLKCASLTTRGHFYNANTYAELTKSLENSLQTEKNVEGKIIDK